jgi:endonuclease/exonuclease/phosphatase family metal-dependent hydrolase
LFSFATQDCAVLRVGTLNINTGHGPHGELRELLDRKTVEANLDRIAQLLASEALDVVCLQEVDFDWWGTGRIDQAEWLADRAGFDHVHSFAHHRSVLPRALRDLVRTKDIIFTRDCGTAILSRLPIVRTHEYTFGQTLTANPIVNHFARLLNESKGYTLAEIDALGARVGIVDVHLLNDIVYEIFRAVGRQVRGEIFARAWQIQKLLEHVREHHEAGLPMIVAGDFNSVPREDTLHHVQSGAGDPDDYRRDISMILLREAELVETIPELFGMGTAATIRPFHTYPATHPDRTLDYVFATPELAFGSYRVVPVAVSDHRLVVAELEPRVRVRETLRHRPAHALETEPAAIW